MKGRVQLASCAQHKASAEECGMVVLGHWGTHLFGTLEELSRIRMGLPRAPGPAVVRGSRRSLALPSSRVIASSWACD